MTRWKRNCSANMEYETTIKEKSFVTKIYETRSTGPVKEINKNVDLNTLHLRKNIYFKKVQTSILKVPVKKAHRKTLDIKEGRAIVYKKSSKLSKEEGTAEAFIGEALDDLFGSQFNMNLIKPPSCNGINGMPSPTFDHTTPNSVELKLCLNGSKKSVEDSVVSESQISVDLENGKEHGKVKNFDLNSSEEKKATLIENCEEMIIPSDSTDETVDNSFRKDVKKRRKRKTAVEFLLNACCEYKTPTVEKREVKKPLSYSPVLNGRKSINEDSLLSLADSPIVETGYTLSGRPKKKPGRQPKYKGPVYHFLDMPNKDESVCFSCSSNKALQKPDFAAKDQRSILVSSEYSDVQRQKSVDISIPQTLVEKKRSKKSSLVNQSINDNTTVSKEKPTKRKQIKKIKEKRVEKSSPTKLHYLDNNIVSLLGCRCSGERKEYLVLFENGTSNWIHVTETENQNDILSAYFRNTEQNLNVLQRTLPTKVISNCLNTNKDDSDEFSDDTLSISSFSDITSPGLFKSFDGFQKQSFLPLPNYCNQVGDVTLSKDLNELFKYVISSAHRSLYPFEMTKELVVKNENEFVHVYIKRFPRKINDSMNLMTCRQLIHILEESAVNDNCTVIIINGIDDCFSDVNVFERLLKVDDSCESSYVDEEISILRYLVQTIRNFSKPIVAVIRKATCGLPASLLSLFDMVFDEHFVDNSNTVTNSGKESSPQLFMFPRLTGLTDFNEAKMMGDGKLDRIATQKDLFTENFSYNPLTLPLKNTLKQMKHNCHIKLTSRSRSHSIEDVSHNDTAQNITQRTRSNNNEQSKLNLLQEQVNDEMKKAKLELCELKSSISMPE